MSSAKNSTLATQIRVTSPWFSLPIGPPPLPDDHFGTARATLSPVAGRIQRLYTRVVRIDMRRRPYFRSEMEPTTPLLLREPPRSRALGLGVAIGAVALGTLAIYPLKAVAPAVSLGVVYLLAVIGVSIFWGLRLGLLTAIASALAFNFFHIPPVGHFTIADSRNWVALAAFLITGAIASTLAE